MLTALFLLATGAPAAAADPLAEARAGKIQCITPNVAAKTCAGMVRYQIKDASTFDSTATMLIAPTPLITIEIKNSGTVENGMTCNVVNQADYAAGKVMMDGAPANEAMAQAVLSQLGAAIQPLAGKKACGSDSKEGDVIVAKAIVDGAPMPALDQRFIWVKPEDGYKLGQ